MESILTASSQDNDLQGELSRINFDIGEKTNILRGRSAPPLGNTHAGHSSQRK
jgi:hypothetical protein